VARRLRKRGPAWHVLHAVPVGSKDSDIDHVVIGPPGVFTLNTKNHIRSKVWVTDHVFMVNGQKKSYLRNSRFEAEHASTLLSAAYGFDLGVVGVIVVMAATLTIKVPPTDVEVVGREEIARWLSSRRPVFEPETVAAIFGHARLLQTWHAT
jgi:Nuclease-related domain